MPILCEVSKFPLHAVCSHHKVDISNFAVYVGQCYSFFFSFFFSPLMKKRTFSNMQLCNYWLLVADKTSVVTFLWCRLHIYCAFFFFILFFLKQQRQKQINKNPWLQRQLLPTTWATRWNSFWKSSMGWFIQQGYIRGVPTSWSPVACPVLSPSLPLSFFSTSTTPKQPHSGARSLSRCAATVAGRELLNSSNILFIGRS